MNSQEQIIPISETGELVYTHWDQLTQISKQVMDAGISKLGNPAQINLIILKGKRLGLDLFEALENITVINNKTSINGALASALVERSGLLIDKSHVYEGEGDARKCSVTVQRKGRKHTTWSFTIKEAKSAGLYPGKSGSGWSSYPDSMLYWRALGFCYRREFPDVLQGMYLTEELADEVHEIKVVTDAPSARVVTPPPDPDSVDTVKAMTSPLISEPSMVNPPANPVIQSDNPESSDLEQLRALAAQNNVTEAELIEVVNGFRLFPRGVEHKLETLPEEKVLTLIKNWVTVTRQLERLRKAKA